jgi:hypothetical protein
MFDNRRANNWRLMLAIADQAGDDWDNQARSATKILRPIKVTSPPTLTPGRWINPNPRSIIAEGGPVGTASSARRLWGEAMTGSPAPRKGNRLERALVRLLQAHGFDAARVPLSGTAGGRFSGDLAVPVLGRDLCVEVKARAAGFRELYSWLDRRDVLIVKADRQEPLVVVRPSLAAEIAKLAA